MVLCIVNSTWIMDALSAMIEMVVLAPCVRGRVRFLAECVKAEEIKHVPFVVAQEK
jgi:hypothetical protein